MSDTIISLNDVQLSLQGNAGLVHILKDISLDIQRAQSVSLTGPSGSGKSSLLMLLGGLEAVSSGKLEVLGRDFSSMDEDALAIFRRAHMGVVFQSFHLIPTMTALENVATPLELAGRNDAFEASRAELNDVGLGDRGEHYPAQLSGGEQQRVALARAAVMRPGILLADEPTGNLDGPTGAAIMDLIFKLKEKHGSTLILVTHDPILAQRCERVVHLTDGRLVSDHRQETEVSA